MLTIPLFWFFFPLPSWPIRHCLYNEAEIKCSRRTIFPFVSGGAPVCMKLRHLQIFHKSTRKEAQLLSIWKPTVCWNTRLDTKPYMLSIKFSPTFWNFYKLRLCLYPKLKSTCDVNLLSKLSIIFKKWRVIVLFVL